MKSERVNSIIFTVSFVVFLLQVVGYLAPAWFVQEVAVHPDARDIRADGRRFQLPYLQNTEDLLEKQDQAQAADERDDENEMYQDLDDDLGKGKVKRSIGKGSDNQTKEADNNDRPWRPTITFVKPDKNKAGPDKDKGMINGLDKNKTDSAKDKGMINEPNTNKAGLVNDNGMINGPDTNKTEPAKDNDMINGPDTNKLEETKQDKTNLDKEEAGVKDKNKKNTQTNMKQRNERRNKILYLTAGLWYSRACITTRNLESDDDDDGMQWCTLYTRFDDSTLEKRKNMFELRLEATVGIVLSALSLVISSTACCSHRHRGCGAMSSLAALFISGAVTAIPVVHMILQHLQMHENIVRARNWMLLTKTLYMQHDLFDHYSVILCGVASLISVLSAFIITIISCKSSASKPDNWYDLRHVQEEKESKNELPIHWIHNNKITVPQVSKIEEETNDDSESGYSEVKEEVTASVHDGGSTGNDCERLELDSSEMKTFDL